MWLLITWVLAGHLAAAEPTIHLSNKLPEGVQRKTHFDFSYYQTSDGVEILVDEKLGKLSYRTKPDGEWKLVREGVFQKKTIGGEFHRLSFQYLGNEKFAIVETLEGSWRGWENQNLPSAECRTILFDAKADRVLEETEPARYSGHPYPEIPPEWKTKYALTFYKWSSDYGVDLGVFTGRNAGDWKLPAAAEE